ncbi:MAG: ABC-type Fe3+ transport system periplasmic component [Noviherbaspirillum sp.]|nr:ABC-type Fe3+ transport system periplasmic component [Noviherbaspirillum sp.]
MQPKSNWMKFLILATMALSAGQASAQAAGSTPLPADWQQTVERANKEGKLILFGQANNNYRTKIIAGFNKQYPNIRVEYRAGTKNADLLSKIVSEKRAGVHEVDLLLWGASSTYGDLLPMGYVVPVKDILVLPELKDPTKWVGGKLQYADKEEKHVAAYAQFIGKEFLVNTKMVDVSKMKSYEDLFDPKLAGKIVVAHPKDVGQAQYSFGFFYFYYGEEFFKKLAAQKPVVVKDVKQLIEWVAHGKYAIGIGPGNQAAFQELVDAGIPVEGMVLKEGGYYSPGYNNVSLMNKAPHPNAAKVFANWLFTKEGQEVVISALGGSSVRTDVSSPLVLDKDKKWFAPHLESSDPIRDKAIEAFNKYIPQ